MFGVYFNGEILLWLWIIPSFLCIMFPQFYFWKKKSYSEDELIQISPKFHGVNRRNTAWGLSWGFFLVILIFAWKHNFEYPLIVAIFSSLALYHALFALSYGAYPQPKVLLYYYAKQSEIHRVAKIQIFIALAISTFALLLHSFTHS